MHPEMSLVLLTVLAGAGQGIFILLVSLDALFHGAGVLPSGYILASGIVAVIFQVAGIAASTSHLGNPQRGWRAMLMLKNSWLSREVLTLSVSLSSAVLYMVLFWTGTFDMLRLIVGLLGVLFGLGFYLSSSMVYASVKFIREWANTFTPLNFFIFGIASGFAVSLPVLYYTQTGELILSGVHSLLLVIGSVSLCLKILAYRFNSHAYVSVNIKNAVGINDPNIKLIDMGTSYDHYNTKEYFFPISKQVSTNTKASVLILAFVLPLGIWGTIASHGMKDFNAVLSIIAAMSMITGLVLERRMFFIQGNNVQNLYYANFRHTGARNPLQSKARKGTPVPTG